MPLLDAPDNENRPRAGTALAELWDAYDNELQAAGVLMLEFGLWRERVSRGDEVCAVGAAFAALRGDIEVARAHDQTHDEKLLSQWLERLRQESSQ